MKNPKTRVRLIAGAAAAIGLSASLTAATATPAHADQIPYPLRGCPANAICIYPAGTGWNHNKPQLVQYFHAGPRGGDHYETNLTGMYGTHRVFNNGEQVSFGGGGGISQVLWLNTGYNGGGNHRPILAGKSYDVNLTPINSITLLDIDV